MGEGFYMTTDKKLAHLYAKESVENTARKQGYTLPIVYDERQSFLNTHGAMIEIDIQSFQKDNPEAIFRTKGMKPSVDPDNKYISYVSESPIPWKYVTAVYTKGNIERFRPLSRESEVSELKKLLLNPPSIIATGAPHKIAEYKEQLGEGFTFNDKYDLPEVEADPKTVALYKSKLGYEVMGRPVLVEDTTLHIEGMSANDASKIKFIVKNLDRYIGRTAVERVYIGYSDGEKVYLYLGETKGRLLSPRGDKGFGYDLYFAPEGSDKTYAERKVISSRTKAIKKMLADEPDYVGPVPPEWRGEWQAGYSPAEGIRENPPLDYPDDLAEAFEMMKRQAKKNRELEMTEGFDAYGWWKFEQKDAIDAKYGKAVVPGASWKLPVFDPDFDPHIPDKQPQPNYENDFHPLKPGQKEPDVKNHFYNQLMRLPQTSPPTPRKILQVALNIGQGHANGTVTEDYTIDDFIEVGV